MKDIQEGLQRLAQEMPHNPAIGHTTDEILSDEELLRVLKDHESTPFSFPQPQSEEEQKNLRRKTHRNTALILFTLALCLCGIGWMIYRLVELL